jgi:1,4-dihydroxy-2-naphthoate octaprenyltransferase
MWLFSTLSLSSFWQSRTQLLVHLRLPFSFFLMPVFLFTLATQSLVNKLDTFYLFLILHLLVYPSSNGYNSYMDQDEGSIGGIEKPEKIGAEMFWLSFFLDSLAIVLSFILINLESAFGVFVYILASRMYSYRKVRLKKYPIIGYLTVVIFQGSWVYMLLSFVMSGHLVFNDLFVAGMCTAGLMIGAVYPLTQIYQHKQDAADGVRTLSMLLGVKGTLIFSQIMLLLLAVLMAYYLLGSGFQWYWLLIFVGVMSPVLVFLTRWMFQVFAHADHANFKNAMWMNTLGSTCSNLFFILLFLSHL